MRWLSEVLQVYPGWIDHEPSRNIFEFCIDLPGVQVERFFRILIAIKPAIRGAILAIRSALCPVR